MNEIIRQRGPPSGTCRWRLQFLRGYPTLVGARVRWVEAAHVSQQAVYQITQHRDAPALYVANMPEMFISETYILKCYAFHFWRSNEGLPMPPVRCDKVLLDTEHGRLKTVLAPIPEAFSDYHDPRPDERIIELKLLSTRDCPNSPEECFRQATTTR